MSEASEEWVQCPRCGLKHRLVVKCPRCEGKAGASLSRSSAAVFDEGATAAREILALVVGAVVAVLCAAGWIGFIVWTGYEVGLVAWLLGAVVGLAVRVARGTPGFLPGLVSALYAVLAIAGVKWLLVLAAGDARGIVGIHDALWVSLAAFTAFRVASRDSSDE